MQSSLSFILVFWYFSFSCLFGQTYGSFTDTRDNKAYKTIEIGDQVWMAENLKFGVPKESPYYVGVSNYYDLLNENYHIYGRLYPWETACKACPDGWYLPSITEWYALINSFGHLYDDDYTIPTLKEFRKTPKEVRRVRNELARETFDKFQEGGLSGFNVLYGGYYELQGPGPFSGLGTIARFWSSSDNVETGMFKSVKAKGFRFDKWGKSFSPWPFLKDARCSVRCVKDIIQEEENID